MGEIGIYILICVFIGREIVIDTSVQMVNGCHFFRILKQPLGIKPFEYILNAIRFKTIFIVSNRIFYRCVIVKHKEITALSELLVKIPIPFIFFILPISKNSIVSIYNIHYP